MGNFVSTEVVRKRGRPPKTDDADDHRRHHGAVYYIVQELLNYFEEPHTISEAAEYINQVILPSIGSAKLESRAIFKIIRDLRGLSLQSTREKTELGAQQRKNIRQNLSYLIDDLSVHPEIMDLIEEPVEEWRAYLVQVGKKGRQALFQRGLTARQSMPQIAKICEDVSEVLGRILPSSENDQQRLFSLRTQLKMLSEHAQSQLAPDLPLFNNRYWTLANTPFATSAEEYHQCFPVLLEILRAIKNRRGVFLHRLDKNFVKVRENFYPVKMAMCEDRLYVLGLLDPSELSLQRRSLSRIQKVELLEELLPAEFPSPKILQEAEQFFRYTFGASLASQDSPAPVKIQVKYFQKWIESYLLGQQQLAPRQMDDQWIEITAWPSETLECWLRGRKAMGQIDFDEAQIRGWRADSTCISDQDDVQSP